MENATPETGFPVGKPQEPCDYCTAGNHEKYGKCPHCDGTGVKDDEPIAQEPEVPEPGSMAGKKLDDLTLDELRGLAQYLGLLHLALPSVKDLRDEIETFTLTHGRGAVDSAINVAEPATGEGYWQFGETTDGVMDAVDPSGWYTANVNSDGSAELVILGYPNLQNRNVGSSSDDVTVKMKNLKGFIDRLTALNKAANLTFKK